MMGLLVYVGWAAARHWWVECGLGERERESDRLGMRVCVCVCNGHWALSALYTVQVYESSRNLHHLLLLLRLASYGPELRRTLLGLFMHCGLFFNPKTIKKYMYIYPPVYILYFCFHLICPSRWTFSMRVVCTSCAPFSNNWILYSIKCSIGDGGGRRSREVTLLYFEVFPNRICFHSHTGRPLGP